MLQFGPQIHHVKSVNITILSHIFHISTNILMNLMRLETFKTTNNKQTNNKQTIKLQAKKQTTEHNKQTTRNTEQNTTSRAEATSRTEQNRHKQTASKETHNRTQN